jgi:hypothetical protein
MPTTTNLGLPYPGLTNAPNVPADIQALAVALDTPRPGSSYTASGSFVGNAGTTGNIDITYGVTFTAAVWAVGNGGSGAGPIVTTEAATTTGCEFIVRNASGAVVAGGSGPYRINWSATGVLA